VGRAIVEFKRTRRQSREQARLAATMAKSLLLQTEFNAMRKRLHMPPALPSEEAAFNEED
jgi:hypothetical protein